jgi:hypothetical protein
MKPAKLISLLVLLCFWCAIAQGAAGSSYDLIETAFAAGELETEERLIYLVQSVRNQEALPDRFRSEALEIEKSATDIFFEVHERWDQFSEETQALLRPLLARPTATHSMISPFGVFKIHYNITGTHAVSTTDVNPNNGIPDYIDWLADYADSSYQTEVTNLGHLPPPSDFSGGGDSRYDIYTENMPYNGYTQPEGAGDRAWADYYSYVSVENNFSGFPPNDDPEGDQKGAMKVTVAHEYYHAIQLGYEVNMGSDVWFMEISSTWMEEWAFPLVNDNYNYLSSWFSYPYYSLHSTSGLHPYAAFIWAKYLEERFGGQIMQEIWAHTIGSTPYNDLESIIGNHGSTLEDEFSEFCIWNFITGTRDDGLHYESAPDYPSISIERSHAAYPAENQSPSSTHRPDAMATNYIRFYLPSGEGTFTINFNGDNSTPWRVKVLKYDMSPSDVYYEDELAVDGLGDGTYVVNDPENWDQVILIPVNVSQTLNDRNYVYDAYWQPWTGYDVEVNRLADDSVYSATWTNVKFEVVNIGLQPDDFDLSAADNLGWTVSASPSSIYLEIGEADTVDVDAFCTSGTTEGVTNTIILSATATSAIGVVDVDSCETFVFVQRGDADNSGAINITDAVHLITYIFASGPAPVPIDEAGDADCDGITNISDAVAIISYIFAGGPYPPCNPF